MPTAARDTAPSPGDDQERLAASLVACLGLEGAMHACQANNWDGVLKVLALREQAATEH